MFSAIVIVFPTTWICSLQIWCARRWKNLCINRLWPYWQDHPWLMHFMVDGSTELLLRSIFSSTFGAYRIFCRAWTGQEKPSDRCEAFAGWVSNLYGLYLIESYPSFLPISVLKLPQIWVSKDAISFRFNLGWYIDNDRFCGQFVGIWLCQSIGTCGGTGIFCLEPRMKSMRRITKSMTSAPQGR